MKASEIADKINAHLKRFEADKKINKIDPKYGTSRFYQASAWGTGNGRVSVCYVGYQGARAMTKADAERYLAWLDAGNVGRHYEALREPA